MTPTRLQPGFAASMQARARLARHRLVELLGPSVSLCGFSTHFSISTPADLGGPVALGYARRFAPALMLLLSDSRTPGLLVRPRPGRTELCGEYVDGDWLRAAAVFAAGSTLVCINSLRGDRPGVSDVAPAVEGAVEPAVERYGWYVDRNAFGEPRRPLDRTSWLRLAAGGRITAQRHLEIAWESARDRLDGFAGADDIDVVTRMVAGEAPLLAERLNNADLEGRPEVPRSGLAMGDVRRPRHRGDYELAPVMITWDTTVYLLVDLRRTRRAFACVPNSSARTFLYRLLHGQLDRILSAYLRAAPAGRVLGRAGKPTHQASTTFSAPDPSCWRPNANPIPISHLRSGMTTCRSRRWRSDAEYGSASDRGPRGSDRRSRRRRRPGRQGPACRVCVGVAPRPDLSGVDHHRDRVRRRCLHALGATRVRPSRSAQDCGHHLDDHDHHCALHHDGKGTIHDGAAGQRDNGIERKRVDDHTPDDAPHPTDHLDHVRTIREAPKRGLRLTALRRSSVGSTRREQGQAGWQRARMSTALLGEAGSAGSIVDPGGPCSRGARCHAPLYGVTGSGSQGHSADNSAAFAPGDSVLRKRERW